MQASTNASLKLDRARGVLQVKGDLESIDEVRNQLQRLTGPFVGVTASMGRADANSDEPQYIGGSSCTDPAG